MQLNEIRFKTIGGEGIKVTHRDNSKVVEIDTEKAEFRGMKVSGLGRYGRRKFENLVFLNSTDEKRLPIKICYKP